MTSAEMTTQTSRLAAIDALAAQFRARAPQHDKDAAFPTENFAQLREAGLLALTVPERWGGCGLWWDDHYVEYYEILERLAVADTNMGQLLQVHSHALGILSLVATEEQAQKYLVDDIVRHGKLVASVGSESAPKATRGGLYQSELEPLGDGRWRLTCEKHFASLGPGADYLMIWVAVPGDESYALRTTLVLVPRNAPEVEMIDEWDVMGMRSTVSWGVKISGYEVPADAVFGVPGSWVQRDPRTFTLGFTANHVGAAQAALDFAVDWVRDRPYLGTSDLVQHMIGDLASDVFAARSALYAAARLWERGDHDIAELESLKALHVAKRVVLDATRRAFDICGARVAFRMFPLEQMYRDARTFTLHFRDEQYTKNVGAGMIERSFSGKGYIEGALLPGQNA